MNLAESTENFLQYEMCIDLKDLKRKLSESAIKQYADETARIIEKFHDALSQNDPEAKIQETYEKAEHLWENAELYKVLDPLRHAFDGFAFNGLRQLYTRQERECWYPKIVLARELKPNDIHKLDESVLIFRGCDILEFASGDLGQSWTTRKNVAIDFAYKHYQDQEWYRDQDRIVLASMIPRGAVLYSDQKVEFEVVVNPDLLQDVRIVDNHRNTQRRS